MTPRMAGRILFIALLLAPLAVQADGKHQDKDKFPFLEATVAQLQAEMAAGRLTRRQPACWRRRDSGQDQPVRVGQLPLLRVDQRLVRGRWPDSQPLWVRSQPLRLELRIGCRGVCQLHDAVLRHRDRRQRRSAGTAFSEPKLIALASGFEAVTHERAKNLPNFTPTIPDDHIAGQPLNVGHGKNDRVEKPAGWRPRHI